MSQSVYLLRNGDLYNIGVSKNIERTKQSLRPGNIVSILYTDNSKTILQTLQNRYSQKRLPNSDYFRLTKEQVDECKTILENQDNINKVKPLLSKINKIFIFFTVWIVLSLVIIKTGIDPLFSWINSL